MVEPVFEFPRPFKADNLPDSGARLSLRANESECSALADRFDVLAIDRFEAHLDIRRSSNGKGLVVLGSLEAHMTQSCVVTLKSLQIVLKSSFERRFAKPAHLDKTARNEIDIDVEERDPPDPIINGVIDLGEVACEQLALEIDPFPRSEGATFESFSDEPVEEKPPHPFAALEELKIKLKKGESDA